MVEGARLWLQGTLQDWFWVAWMLYSRNAEQQSLINTNEEQTQQQTLTIALCNLPKPPSLLGNTDDDSMVPSAEERAAALFRGVLFPISYVGFGMRFLRLGLLSAEHAAASIGCLVVLWLAQTTVGKLINCLELLLL